MDSSEILDEIASNACVSLFSDYALPLGKATSPDEALHTELVYCSVIGFSSEQLRGTLLLAASKEPVGRTSPVSGAAAREWVAELANQLLGRIKGKLAERGVLLALSTPLLLRGEHLRPLSSHEMKPIVFTCEGGCVCVWLDAELSPELDLSQVQTDCQVMGEGEALLF